MSSNRNDLARDFRRLHEQGLLILPNAWDAGSARLCESLGAKAIATTSAGVAWSHGYPDGDALPTRLLMATVAEIGAAIRVPLSVDVEGGYSDDPSQVGRTVGAVIEAGAAGINIEDGASDPALFGSKLEAIRSAAARLGSDLFVNARTDVFLRGLAPKERRVEETLARSARYRAAGADGIFVPGVTDAAEIRAIAEGSALPLNVLAFPGLPPAADLESLGVRRLSAGSGIAQALYGKAARLAAAFLETGESGPLGKGAKPYAEINALMARSRE